MFGCREEKLQPIQKVTGLQANMSLRNSLCRCQGHQGKVHGQLQASYGGINRTTSAAVYPVRLCKAIIEDVKKFSRRHKNEVYHYDIYYEVYHYDIYYKCEKCRLGKNAPPGVEHSLVPRECRHASKLPNESAPASSSAGVNVRRIVNVSVHQLMEEFRQEAMKHKNLDDIMLRCPEHIKLTAMENVTLRYVLMKLLEDSVNIISETKSKHMHWTEDAVYLTTVRGIFRKILDVKEICCAPHAQTTPMPMPYLRTASLRMVIKGDVKRWVMFPVGDLRTLTDQEIKEKKFHEDWLIVIFGSEINNKDHWEVAQIRGKVTRHHVELRKQMCTPMDVPCPVEVDELGDMRTTYATPYDDSGPKVNITDNWTRRDAHKEILDGGRCWTGTTVFDIIADDDKEETKDPLDRIIESQKEEMRDNEDEQAEYVDETSREPLREPLRPLYDFRRVLQRLPRVATDDPQQGRRILLYRSSSTILACQCWGSPQPPHASGHAKECLGVASRPKVKVHHADTFSQELQLDIFYLCEHAFLIMVDVAARFKSVVKIMNKDLDTLMKALLHNWVRWFGPPPMIISGQESALMSPAAAAECERLNIIGQRAVTTRTCGITEDGNWSGRETH